MQGVFTLHSGDCLCICGLQLTSDPKDGALRSFHLFNKRIAKRAVTLNPSSIAGGI